MNSGSAVPSMTMVILSLLALKVPSPEVLRLFDSKLEPLCELR